MSITTTFTHNFPGFSGPARGVIARDTASELILPTSHGDCVVRVIENQFNVQLDETGESNREVYGLGYNVEIDYPIKVADIDAYGWAIRSDSTLAATADFGASSSLSARTTLQLPVGPRKITPVTFEIWSDMEPVRNDASAVVITRTSDLDYWSIYLAECVFMRDNDPVITFHNNESAFMLKGRGVLTSASTNIARLFNTDLATA